MSELQFKKWDTILGWVAFLVALITFGLTVEPTVSYWDCGEYIATSAKLQVGHPPGAPLFQMVGAFFATFASSPETIAKTINYMSVFSSAFTILFLFWTITNLTKKLVLKHSDEFNTPKAIAVLGSGLVGALAFTFSDSFWFNAVEAEVYAMATFLMSLMFYLGLRWKDEMHTPRGNKWLILIFLIVGLSFGVHFMALLTIPAIGMIYYFNHYEFKWKSFIIANIVSVAILLFIFKLLLPSTLKFFGYLEVFSVNSLGMPFNSGTIIAGIIIVTAFYLGLQYTRKKGYVQLNTLVLCTMFILVGFSTWLMIPIRANAGTVINENSPSDARLLLAYYNLEQYPETHLFYGPMYSDAFSGQDLIDPYEDEKPKYERDYKTGKYIIVNHYKDANPAPNRNHVGFLPRMWSPEHAENYMKITGPIDFRIKGQSEVFKILERQYGELSTEERQYFYNNLRNQVNTIKSNYRSGEIDEEDYVGFIRQTKEFINVEKPSFSQNMKYLFEFQMGYMFWRYFMWNFTGRQDDIQGKYDNHGNWLSGIKFIDEWRLGPQNNLPDEVLNNKARNTYFFLPLILGIIGLVFQIRNNPKQWWVVFILFMFTGLALKVYLNERPFEPRERDYALVGSFYMFSIWIGMGVYALFDELKKLLTPKILAPVITVVCMLAVPTVMAYQNWDDHNRAHKYTARAMATSYLDSVAKDKGSILFSIGDNDTFALWYGQEVEGYRTDVRVINTSLFATDWYIDQMKSKAYESDPIPSQLTHDQYVYGVRDAIYYQPLTEARWNIKDFMNWISSDDKRTKIDFGNGQETVFYPTNKIRVPVNKEHVLKSGIVQPKDSALIVDYIDIDLPKSALVKSRILMLDLLANNDWKRPIYFTGGSFDSAEYLWMKDYLQLDGLVYKLVPIKTQIDKNNPYEMGRIDSDVMYDIVMKWDWGNSNDPRIYVDPESRRNSISYRSNLARLSETLIKEGKLDKAKNVLDLAMDKMPFGRFGYYVFLEPYIDGYYKVDEKEKARALFLDVASVYQQYLDYYSTMDLNDQRIRISEIVTNMERYRSLVNIVALNDDKEFGVEASKTFNDYIDKFSHLYKPYQDQKPESDLEQELQIDSVKDTVETISE